MFACMQQLSDGSNVAIIGVPVNCFWIFFSADSLVVVWFCGGLEAFVW